MGVGAAKGVTLGREGVDQGGADGLEKPSVEIRHGSARVKISAIEFSARVEVTMAEVYGGSETRKKRSCAEVDPGSARCIWFRGRLLF